MKIAKSNRDEVRENSLTITMLKTEKEAVAREAAKIGLSMSAWVRMILAEKINQK